MIERIRELSPGQIDRLKQLGQDALTAISPPIASMVYGNDPDQLAALQQIGPDALGAMSPQLADMIYGPAGAVTDQGLGDDLGGVTDQGLARGKRRQPPIILPPFPIPPDDSGDDEDGGGGDEGYQPDPEDYVSWNVSPGKNNCQTCLGNADDAPRPYGVPFSSGDKEPPIHEYCGCFLTSGIRGSCPIHGHGRRVFELSSRY